MVALESGVAAGASVSPYGMAARVGDGPRGQATGNRLWGPVVGIKAQAFPPASPAKAGVHGPASHLPLPAGTAVPGSPPARGSAALGAGSLELDPSQNAVKRGSNKDSPLSPSHVSEAIRRQTGKPLPWPSSPILGPPDQEFASRPAMKPPPARFRRTRPCSTRPACPVHPDRAGQSRRVRKRPAG